MALARSPSSALHDRQLDQLVEVQQPGAEPVVDVVIVVGDVVGDRGDLRLEARPGAKLEVPLGIRFGHAPSSALATGPLCLARPSSASQLRLSPSKSG